MKAKKIFAALFSVLFFSCSEQEVNDSVVELVDISIPSAFQTDSNARTNSESEIEEVNVQITTEDGQTFDGVMKFTMPVSPDESLLKLEVSQNILDRTNSTPDFWVEYYGNGSARTENSCIASCHEEFTDENGNKISGRGWCKAECWAKTLAGPIAAVTVAIITK